jgi:hypothetical protein
VRRRSTIARPSHRIRVVSQLLCVGRSLPSQIICAENDHLLRVWPVIIARHYSYGGSRGCGRCGITISGGGVSPGERWAIIAETAERNVYGGVDPHAGGGGRLIQKREMLPIGRALTGARLKGALPC